PFDLTLEPQCVAELQVRVRMLRIEAKRFPIGRHRPRQIPQFLEHVSVLHPDRRQLRLLGQRLPVITGGERPLAGIAGPVGPRYPRAQTAFGPRKRQARSALAPGPAGQEEKWPCRLVREETGGGWGNQRVGGDRGGADTGARARYPT